MTEVLKIKLPGMRRFTVGNIVYASQGQFPLSSSVKMMLVYYSVKAWLGKSIKLSKEHEAAHWVAVGEIGQYLMPGTDRLAILEALRPELTELG